MLTKHQTTRLLKHYISIPPKHTRFHGYTDSIFGYLVFVANIFKYSLKTFLRWVKKIYASFLEAIEIHKVTPKNLTTQHVIGFLKDNLPSTEASLSKNSTLNTPSKKMPIVSIAAFPYPIKTYHPDGLLNKAVLWSSQFCLRRFL